MRTTAKLACLTLTLAALVAGLSYVQYGRLRRTVDQQLFCRVLPAYDENECDSSECPEVHIPSKIGSAPFRMVVYPAKDVVAGALLADSSWEPHGTLQICYAIIKTPGTTFVDIGANLGWYTLFAAAQGAAVVAIEPMESNLMRLRRSICRNPHMSKRITLVSSALGMQSQSNCTMFSDVSNTGNGILSCNQEFNLPPGYKLVQQGIHVQQIDDILQHIQTVGVLKMDIEGAEHYAVLGGNHTFFQRKIPYLMIEYSPLALGPAVSPDPPQSFLQKFERAGYALSTESFDAMVPMSIEHIHAATNHGNLVEVFMTYKGQDRATKG